MDIMTTEDRELILAELYKLQHPAGPSLEQVIHEQRSYCSDYSEHSSGTPREELTEPVGLPAVRRQPCDTDTTEVVLQLDVENKRYDRILSVYQDLDQHCWEQDLTPKCGKMSVG